MARSPRPSVALFSAPGTLAQIDRPLLRAGVRLLRVTAVRPQPLPARRWLNRLARAPKPDTLIVTSRSAVSAGVLRWRHELGRFLPGLAVWAVGPGTAQALREAGIRRVHRPRAVGAAAIARSIGRGTARRIVYFRSNAAGPGLARTLRGQGHFVMDLVVYRLGAPPRLTPQARQTLTKADLLVVTSPSALAQLRCGFDRRSFDRFARSAHLVVLGARSRRAARVHGFRHIAVAPSTTAQRFTRYLLRELHDASA
jgi:uroporphyrinogen-III synthase